MKLLKAITASVSSADSLRQAYFDLEVEHHTLEQNHLHFGGKDRKAQAQSVKERLWALKRDAKSKGISLKRPKDQPFVSPIWNETAAPFQPKFSQGFVESLFMWQEGSDLNDLFELVSEAEDVAAKFKTTKFPLYRFMAIKTGDFEKFKQGNTKVIHSRTPASWAFKPEPAKVFAEEFGFHGGARSQYAKDRVGVLFKIDKAKVLLNLDKVVRDPDFKQAYVYWQEGGSELEDFEDLKEEAEVIVQLSAPLTPDNVYQVWEGNKFVPWDKSSL